MLLLCPWLEQSTKAGLLVGQGSSGFGSYIQQSHFFEIWCPFYTILCAVTHLFDSHSSLFCLSVLVLWEQQWVTASIRFLSLLSGTFLIPIQWSIVCKNRLIHWNLFRYFHLMCISIVKYLNFRSCGISVCLNLQVLLASWLEELVD